jgi:uncharacterized protein YueI
LGRQATENKRGEEAVGPSAPPAIVSSETTPLALVLKDKVPVNAVLDFIRAQKLMEVEKLSKAITEILAQVAEKATRDRKAAIR